jgi:hypothetical protein
MTTTSMRRRIAKLERNMPPFAGFNACLKHLTEDQHDAVTAVASVSALAKLWLEDAGLKPTAGDVLYMANMMLVREQWLHGFGEEQTCSPDRT